MVIIDCTTAYSPCRIKVHTYTRVEMIKGAMRCSHGKPYNGSLRSSSSMLYNFISQWFVAMMI